MTHPSAEAITATSSLPDHDVVPAVWARFSDLDIARGEGSWLITRDGTRYLDEAFEASSCSLGSRNLPRASQ